MTKGLPTRGLACVAVAALLLLPRTLAAAEYSIRPDGSGDFPTIQAAIEAASSGDTVILEDGVFTGEGNRDLSFAGKDLIVHSRNGAAACTIDSEGSPSEPHRAFRLSDGETAAARIEGLTITGGYATGPFPENSGAGILVEYGTHPVINACIFDGNEAGHEGFGAGLLAWEDCDITLTNCTFVNGVSGWYGGGFTLRKHCDALVENCRVIGNRSGHAGGGVSITCSDAIVNDCVFAGNVTTEVDGGGVLVKAGARPVFTNCVFAGNTAFLGGALGVANYPEVTAINCLFVNNTGTCRGGAVSVAELPCAIILESCTFIDNRAPAAGAHVFVGPQCAATLTSCILGRYCDDTHAVWIANGASADIECSVVLGGGVQIGGPGNHTYGVDNVDADPLFCAPNPDSCDADPLSVGDHTLDSMSPAAPSWHPCGLAGAYPVQCGVTSAAEEGALLGRSWTRIKAGYR